MAQSTPSAPITCVAKVTLPERVAVPPVLRKVTVTFSHQRRSAADRTGAESVSAAGVGGPVGPGVVVGEGGAGVPGSPGASGPFGPPCASGASHPPDAPGAAPAPGVRGEVDGSAVAAPPPFGSAEGDGDGNREGGGEERSGPSGTIVTEPDGGTAPLGPPAPAPTAA
ncbi:hypothetical protein SLA_3850 [Streptomyces laurentii]|uniref:Uncharacterized protein n=1 Tax=Streptomyces laurentii TaxID=39478 RepID=A0A161JWB5_STRLU|nr:hypothetical protein SLA_3850 [Streptomyces laurentii]